MTAMISSTLGGSAGYRSPLLRGGRPAWNPGMVAGERRRPARSSRNSDMAPPRARGRARASARCVRWMGACRSVLLPDKSSSGVRPAASAGRASLRQRRCLSSTDGELVDRDVVPMRRMPCVETGVALPFVLRGGTGVRYVMVSCMSAFMSRSSDRLRSPGEGATTRGGPRHQETAT
jgi:hypothetical protein